MTFFDSCLKKFGVRIVFVRTKIDETIDHEQQQSSKSSTTENILAKVRKHCESSLRMTYSPDCRVHLISSRFPSNWDANGFVNDVIKNSQNQDPKSKTNIALSLSPMAPDMLSVKYQLLNERIWKVAVMSVSSGKSTKPDIVPSVTKCNKVRF